MEIPESIDTNITEAKAFERYAQAVNADRYRVTCIKMLKDGGKKTFILDKRDGVTKGFTADEMLANIPTMLKLQARREEECTKAHLTARAIAKKYEEQERQKQTHPALYRPDPDVKKFMLSNATNAALYSASSLKPVP